MTPSVAPGAARLRALREEAGKTQLWVETEADLGTGYLQRVESGKVAQPSRATLERILSALAVRYSERRALLEAFGYTLSTPIPTAADIAWACQISVTDLAAAPFPAYVLDCTHRLIAWNRFFPRLLGLGADDPLLRRWARDSFLAAWFDPLSPLAQIVAEPDRFLPALVRAFRYEMRHADQEPWYADLLAQLQTLPRFRQTWDTVAAEPPPANAARSLVPLHLDSHGIGPLQFRVSVESFLRDERFRTVSLFPADPGTIHQCAIWSADPSDPGDADRPS